MKFYQKQEKLLTQTLGQAMVMERSPVVHVLDYNLLTPTAPNISAISTNLFHLSK